MKNSCNRVMSLMALFIENKLDENNKFFVETHLLKCGDCYKKYLDMKKVMNDLHFEYEKLMEEFSKIDSDSFFNIREYETFYNNISPYIDNELCYKDSVKFRKYLLGSKSARAELANAYNLKNNINQSIKKFIDNLNFNYSKKIIKQLKHDNKDSFEKIYKRAAIAILIMVTSLLILTFIGLKFMHNSFSHSAHVLNIEKLNNNYLSPINSIIFPDEKDFIEFNFDENHEPLLTAK